MSVVVSIRNLSYVYADGTRALSDACLEVRQGESLALIGPNGAGKSTLLLHLNGLLQGTGRLDVLGLSVEPRNFAELRRRVGFVFQNPEDQLFMPTVFDEVAFAALNAGYDRREVERRVARVLEQVGMAGTEERAPQNLSLGQKKRLAIGSVLVTECDLLALDEPGAGLDPRGREELIGLLRRLPATKLIATHDLGLARALCSQAALMDGGLIVARRPISALLADDGLLARHGLASAGQTYSSEQTVT